MEDDMHFEQTDQGAPGASAQRVAEALSGATVGHVGRIASSTAPTAQPAQPREHYDKIIVAIHGIGTQRRSDTVRSVARSFGDRTDPPVPVLPLGHFHTRKADEVHVSRLVTDDPDLRDVGFAEVFWADIPRKLVSESDVLEETKAWGASVVSRAQDLYNRKVTVDPQLTAEDFQLGAGVVDEIVETVAVMENLLAVLDKMGVFKFQLGGLLRDYLGDVQVVTEFSYYREQIVERFHGAMTQIVERFSDAQTHKPDIYIVAHSEGTVVSLLGLLQGLSQARQGGAQPGKSPTDWVRFVRGFMTLGSPIDKHLVLWPGLWQGLSLECTREDGAVVFGPGERLRLPAPIEWRNYYEHGDPVGFKLDSAVRYLARHRCVAFNFDTARHDHGFSRYWLPGKAHNDYWTDREVFGHFISDVVMPGKGKTPEPPRSSALVGLVSTAIPYLFSLVLHVAAIYFVFKAVTAFLSHNGHDGLSFKNTVLTVASLGVLLLSVTVAARVPRLVKRAGFRWHGLALTVFLAGLGMCFFGLPQGVASFLGKPLFGWLSLRSSLGIDAAQVGMLGLALSAGFVASTGWWVPRRPRTARRALLACGSALMVVAAAWRIIEDRASGPAWPLALGAMAFLYCWWLGILVFDLAFVWHRYIRESVAVDTLDCWSQGVDAKPRPLMRKRVKAAPAPRSASVSST